MRRGRGRSAGTTLLVMLACLLLASTPFVLAHKAATSVDRGLTAELTASMTPPMLQRVMPGFIIGGEGAEQQQLQSARPRPTPTLTQQQLRARQQMQNPEADSSSGELPTSVSEISGQPSPTFVGEPHDPLLALMPDFAFSMPAQVVVNGLNLALLVVLVVHLAFTTRYHYPLSKMNFMLQAGSTVLLLVNLITETVIILKELDRKSHRYPYMFPYIGLQVPLPDYNDLQTGFYVLLQAVTLFFGHLTHIQYLTLLFPSALEKRLIFWMLGPLALGSAGMLFTALAADADYKTSDLGDAIRNICNSTLTLLYMCALMIWGLLVNRRRAWRTDGGTAAFGGGAMGLAFLNTIISFIEIGYDRLWWLPGVGATLTIWQSWLGFWWWVGSGMGIGEVEDREQRAVKRRKRIERKKRREAKEKAAREKAAALAADDSGAGIASGMQRLRDAISAVGGDADGSHSAGIAATIKGRLRRRTGMSGKDSTGDSDAQRAENEEAIELHEIRTDGHSIRPAHDGITDSAEPASPVAGATNGVASTVDDAQTSGGSADSNPTAASSAPPGALGRFLQSIAAHQPAFIRQRFQRLRIAHAAAARRAATEQTALREQVLNRAAARQTQPGLRSMMMEGNSAEHIDRPNFNGKAEAGINARRGSTGGGGRTRFVDSSSSGSMRVHSPLSLQQRGRQRIYEADETGSSSSRVSAARSAPAGMIASRGLDRRSTSVSPDQAELEDEDWVDEQPEHDQVGQAEDDDDDDDNDSTHADAGAPSGRTGSSWFWSGGLKRARLRDRTTYD